MSSSDDGLDDVVRHSAPDLWLSSRLVVDEEARFALIGLYAIHAELGKVAATVKTPLAGEVRLAWWREEVEAAATGQRPAGHPGLVRLANAPLAVSEALAAIIEARHAELEPRPFLDEPAMTAYIDGVDGALVAGACALLSGAVCPSLTHTGRVLGLSRLLNAGEASRSQGRDLMPATWQAASEEEIAAHLRGRIFENTALMRKEVRGLPVAGFPAVAHAALVGAYNRRGRPSGLEKRMRLIWAALRGNV